MYPLFSSKLESDYSVNTLIKKEKHKAVAKENL
jgi:hypothetical protein